MKFAHRFVPAVGLLLLVGCATGPYRPAVPLTGDPLIDGPLAITDGPSRDHVLWQYRIALAAMQRGQFDIAAANLDEALNRIEGAIGYDRNARKARSLFSSEAKKTFLGEPYERVMAYFYRGLLYWMNGDLANARACFRSAAVMDALAVDETYASDYALLDYLDGFTTAKLGDDATDEFKRAQAIARLTPFVPYNSKANLIMFVDYGRGPVKYATGQYAQELRFRPGTSPARTARVTIAQKHLTAPPYDDLYFQATTRGGRVMDHILANKAVFKTSVDTVGNAAILSGVVLAGNQHHPEAGLGLLAFGVLAKALAGSTTPEADTRTWENLPQYLSFTVAELPPGTFTATVEFLDDANRVLTGLTKTITFTIAAGGADKVLFVSDKSVTPQTI